MTELSRSDTIDNLADRELLLPSTLRSLGRDAVRKSGRLQTGGEPNQFDVLHELDPIAEALLNEHIATRKPWLPANVFPIDDDGRVVRAPRHPDGSLVIPSDVLAATIVGNATEENIPGYFHQIASNTSHERALGEWGRLWAQEEYNHGVTLQSWFSLAQPIAPEIIEQIRVATMNHGYTVEKDPLHMIAYTSFQEKATQVAHRQTGLKSNDPYLNDILKLIAKDEIHHMIFYRSLARAAFDLAPNQMMQAVRDEVIYFEMPGTGIPGFVVHALEIARSGVYDRQSHLDDVLWPILRYWKIFEREDITGEGAKARDELAAFLEKSKARAARFSSQREDGNLDRMIATARQRYGSLW